MIEYSDILESSSTSDFNVEKNLQEEIISNQNPKDNFAIQNEVKKKALSKAKQNGLMLEQTSSIETR